MSVRVRRAVVSDLDAAATLLGLAFQDDPWTRWCVAADDHVRRITELQRVSLEVIGLPMGFVWLGEVNDRVATAAVWSDSRVAAEGSVLIDVADRSRPWHGDRLDSAIDAETGTFERPAAPHWFLETMGTHPEHRRNGFGTAVLQPGLESADHAGLLCALETSTESNVAFYRTLGFDVVDHRVVGRQEANRTGPDVWTMWRVARQP